MDIKFVVGYRYDCHPYHVAERLGATVLPMDVDRFDDGETKTTVDFGDYEISEENVLFDSRNVRFAAKYADPTDPANPAEYTINNIFTLDTLKRQNPKKIIFCPLNMNYGRQDSRQDKEFLPGESWSLKTIAKLYEACGISDLITINSHLCGKEGGESLQSFFESAKIHDIGPEKAFADHLKSQNSIGEEPVIIGPDEGSLKMIKRLASRFEEADYLCFAQKRDPRTRVKEIVSVPPDISKVRGRTAVVYDDVSASGGYLVKTCDVVKRYEPKELYIAVVHLIGEYVIKRLANLGVSGVLTTDSFRLPHETEPHYNVELNNYFKERIQEVSTMPLVADCIRNL